MIRPRLPHAWEVSFYGLDPSEPIGGQALAEADGEEMFRPTPEERAAVQGMPPVKLAVPYRFTVADDAAELAVLGELAALIASRALSPWAAASLMFAGGAAGVDAPGGAPASPETAEMALRHRE